MSDIRDPETDQAAPIPNDGPSAHDLVIADLQDRKEHGLRKYNSLLQPFNGRDSVLDAYEEAQDLVVYLANLLEEQKNSIRVRIVHCSSVEYEHREHFYDYTGPWLYCDGSKHESSNL